MRLTTNREEGRLRSPLFVARTCVGVVIALAANFGFSRQAAAAEIYLSGTGTFKPPSAEQFASLPADFAFSRSDLASGTWSFAARYADQTPDADPDPYVGRYVGAIHAFRLTVGTTTLDLPTDRAELVISDGGLGLPHRESIRLEASASTTYGVIHVGWIQLNQSPKLTDLRGTSGMLSNDSLPQPAVIANLATSSSFDRFLLLRIDRQGGESPPLLYLSSSNLIVRASPAPAQ